MNYQTLSHKHKNLIEMIREQFALTSYYRKIAYSVIGGFSHTTPHIIITDMDILNNNIILEFIGYCVDFSDVRNVKKREIGVFHINLTDEHIYGEDNDMKTTVNSNNDVKFVMPEDESIGYTTSK
jgi:hypothetical protein